MSGIEIDPVPIFEAITSNLVWVLAVFALPIGFKVALDIGDWILDAMYSVFVKTRSRYRRGRGGLVDYFDF